jgi:hypothetical protein
MKINNLQIYLLYLKIVHLYLGFPHILEKLVKKLGSVIYINDFNFIELKPIHNNIYKYFLHMAYFTK